MTVECYETMVVYLQCGYANLANKVATQLSTKGKTCQDTIDDMLDAKSLLRILNCYDPEGENAITECDFCDIYDYVNRLLCSHNCECNG